MGEAIRGELASLERESYDCLADKLARIGEYYATLGPEQKRAFGEVIVSDYLRAGCRRREGIHLCGQLQIAESAPRLMEMAQQPDLAEPDLEALILSLGMLGHAPAYSLIEGYVSSRQSHQALIALAGIDFERAVPHINQQIDSDVRGGYRHARKDGARNPLLVTVSCIFSDRAERYGIGQLMEDLKYFITDDQERLALLSDAVKQCDELSDEDRGRLLERIAKSD